MVEEATPASPTPHEEQSPFPTERSATPQPMQEAHLTPSASPKQPPADGEGPTTSQPRGRATEGHGSLAVVAGRDDKEPTTDHGNPVQPTFLDGCYFLTVAQHSGHISLQSRGLLGHQFT